jgi:uncharacterized protein YbaA (DUF1428 family)
MTRWHLVSLMVAPLLLTLASSSARGRCSVGVPVVANCGLVPFEGCCLDFATVLFCEDGVLCGVDCTGNALPAEQVCGFRQDWGIYDCGGGGGDPWGRFPIDCAGRLPAVPDPGGGAACGSIGAAGCCSGTDVLWCESGALQALECAGNEAPADRVCGWRGTHGLYDCGGSGPDPSGVNPASCAALAPGGSACAGVGYEGCCAGAVVRWCESGAVQQLDCAANEAASERVCGWRAAHQVYDCGGVGADPSGAAPRECPGGSGCTPDCGGKVCGPDGCGGSCGACGADEYCDRGACRPDDQCVPVCAGRECGDNGCGGLCGSCGSGAQCDPQTFRCVDAPACARQCADRACGPDGCGGSCGTCPAGTTCSREGRCVGANGPPPGCTPACGTKACGPDGCGGSCGTCPAGFGCNPSGLCDPGWRDPCSPICDGRLCGPDGCGGSCGTCPAGHACNGQGLCGPGREDGGGRRPAGDTVDGCPAGFERLYGLCVPSPPPGSREPLDAGGAAGGAADGAAGAGVAAGSCAAGGPGAPDGRPATAPRLVLLALALALALAVGAARRGRRAAKGRWVADRPR